MAAETDVATEPTEPGEPVEAVEAKVEDPHAVHERPHPRDSEYIKIAVILAAITAAEVATYYLDVSTGVLLALLIPMMIVKFALVALFFMHLRYDSKAFTGAFVFGIGLAAGVYITALATFQFFG
ncbi:MAG: cytochrome C oxidase subunit IV family protein [Acidimicrobiales bacterium]